MSRSYWQKPGDKVWHIHDGDDVENWRALCGRWPTRFTTNSEVGGLRVCSLCRDVARVRDREDALLAAEAERIAEEREA